MPDFQTKIHQKTNLNITGLFKMYFSTFSLTFKAEGKNKSIPVSDTLVLFVKTVSTYNVESLSI